jgi:hypothetical protein
MPHHPTNRSFVANPQSRHEVQASLVRLAFRHRLSARCLLIKVDYAKDIAATLMIPV